MVTSVASLNVQSQYDNSENSVKDLQKEGFDLLEKSQPKEAQKKFEDSLDLLTQLHGEKGGLLALSHEGLAHCHKKMGAFDNAYTHFFESLKLQEKLPERNPVKETDISLHLAQCCRGLGYFELALEHYKVVLDFWVENSEKEKAQLICKEFRATFDQYFLATDLEQEGASAGRVHYYRAFVLKYEALLLEPLKVLDFSCLGIPPPNRQPLSEEELRRRNRYYLNTIPPAAE